MSPPFQKPRITDVQTATEAAEEALKGLIILPVKGAPTITKAIEEAERKLREVVALGREIDQHRVLRILKELGKTGAPQEFITNVAGCIDFFSKKENQRAELLLKYAELFLKHKDVLMSETGRTMLEALIVNTTVLADQNKKPKLSDGAAALEQMANGLDSLATERRIRALETFEYNIVIFQGLLSKTSGKMHDRIEELIADLEAATRKLKDEKTAGEVKDEEITTLAMRVWVTEKAVADINDMKTAPKAVEAIYLSLLDILKTPDYDSKTYDLLVFAASEAKRYARDTSAQTYLQELTKHCVSLKSKPGEQKATLTTIEGTISSFYLTKLRSAAEKAVDEEIRAQLAKILEKVEKGELSVFKEVETVTAALEILRSRENYLNAKTVGGKSRLTEEERGVLSGIYLRSLAALQGQEIEIATVQRLLGESYAKSRNGREKAEIAALSERLEKDKKAFPDVQIYIHLSAPLARYRENAEKLLNGSDARKALDLAILEIEKTRTRIASGEGLLTKEQIETEKGLIVAQIESNPLFKQQIEQLAAQYGKTAEEVVVILATENANKGAQERIELLVSACSGMLERLEKVKSPRLKKDLGTLYLLSIDAIIRGDVANGTLFANSAALYDSFGKSSRVQRDQGIILQTCLELQAGNLDLETAQSILVVQQQRQQTLSKIANKADVINAQAYFDLALLAAREGSRERMQTVLDLAVLYARAVSTSEKGLAKEQLEKRRQAIGFVRDQLGEYSASKNILQGKRMLDAGAEGKLGWVPIQTELSGKIAAALLGEMLDPSKSAEERLGTGDLASGVKAFEAVSVQTQKHSAAIEHIEFERECTKIAGTSKHEAGVKRARYGRESVKFLRFAKQARAKGETELAEFYERQAKISNIDFVSDSLRMAKEVYARGVGEREQAVKLVEQAGTLLAQGKREEAAGLMQQAQAHAQTGEMLIGSAREILTDLKNLDESIVRINTRNCHLGRYELHTSIKIRIGLADGKDVGLDGEVILRTGTTQLDKQLAEKHRITVASHADGLRELGLAAIAQQRQIQSMRTHGLARAKALLHDRNVDGIRAVITQIIEVGIEDEQDKRGYLEKLKAAGGDLTKLTELYLLFGNDNELRRKTGIRIFDDPKTKTDPIYDAGKYEADYKRVCGLYYAERFSAADRELSAAQDSMGIGFINQQNWTNEEQLWRRQQGLFPHGDKPTNDMEVAHEMVSHLQPDKRAAYRARLAEIEKQGPLAREQGLEKLIGELKGVKVGNRTLGELVDSDQYAGTYSQMVYYDAPAFHRLAKEIEQNISMGDADASQFVRALELDMENAVEVQTQDFSRKQSMKMALGHRKEKHTLLRRHIEEKLGEESARAKGDREDRNEALERGAVTYYYEDEKRTTTLDELHAQSHEINASEWEASAQAHEKARDVLLTQGGTGFKPTPETALMLGLFLSEKEANLKSKSGMTCAELVYGIIHTTDLKKRFQYAQELSQVIVGKPVLLATIMGRIHDNKMDGGGYSIPTLDGVWVEFSDDEIAQLDAVVLTNKAVEGEHQGNKARGYAELMIRKGQENLRYADISETIRYGEYAERPIKFVLDAHQKLRQTGAECYEAAATALLRHTYGHEISMDKKLTLAVFEFRGTEKRKWRDDKPIYLTVYSDIQGNYEMQERSKGRKMSLGGALYSVNFQRAMEIQGFTEAVEHTGSFYYDMAEMETDLDLLSLGIARYRAVETKEYVMFGKVIQNSDEVWRYREWKPTPEDQKLLGGLYEQFMRLKNEVESTVLYHNPSGGKKTSWGEDAQLTFLVRMRERMAYINEAYVDLVSTPPNASVYIDGKLVVSKYAHVEALLGKSVPFKRNDAGQVIDPDETTQGAIKEMRDELAKKRILDAVGEFVVATVGIVAAPVTGGTSLALTVAVGAHGVMRGYETARQEGEWTFMAGFQVAMGVVTMVLPVAGELSSAARLGGSLANVGSEVATASRIITPGQRIVRFMSGTSEMGVTQRTVHTLGTLTMASGFVQFGVGLPSMIKQVESGDMPWWEASAYGLMQSLQGVQVGLAARRGAIAERTGIPAYRPRWLQAVEAFTLGMPFDPAHVHAIARVNAMAKRTFKQLPPHAQENYRAYLLQNGVKLSPEHELDLLTQFSQAYKQGKVVNFDQFAQTREFRIMASEWTYQAVIDGKIPLSRLNKAQQGYVRARNSGKTPEEAFAVFEKPEPRTGPSRTTEGKSDATDQAAVLRARSERLAQERRAEEDRSYSASSVESHFISKTVRGDGTVEYTLERGEGAVVYSGDHAKTATKLVVYAEEVLAGKTNLDKVPANLREQVRALTKDQTFVGATQGKAQTRGTQQASAIREQLGVALDKAVDLPEFATRQDVLRTRYQKKDQAVLRKPDNTSKDLETLAIQRTEEVATLKRDAGELERKAGEDGKTKGVDHPEVLSLKREAEILRAKAAVLEKSAELLRAGAEKLRPRPSPEEVATQAHVHQPPKEAEQTTYVLDEGFRGMPDEFSELRTDPKRGHQKVKLIRAIDDETGAGGGVFLGQMPDGTLVAVKVFRKPDSGSTWKQNAEYFRKEIQSAEILSDLGLGPGYHGIVDADGNMAYAMDIVAGKDPGDMSAAELSKFVNEGAYAQVREMYQTLLDAGYEIGDFQFAVLTQDQVINGKPRKAGDIVFWDAGGLRIIDPAFGPTRTSADVESSFRMRVDVIKGLEHLQTLDFSQPENSALNSVIRKRLGEIGWKASEKLSQEDLRQFIVRVKREERISVIEKIVSETSKTDQPAAREMFSALKRVETETGMQLLSPDLTFEGLMSREEVAVPLARAVGDDLTVSTTSRPKIPRTREELVRDDGIYRIEHMERLLSGGEHELSTDVTEALPGKENAPMRNIARALEQMAEDGNRTIESIQETYPEYSEAIRVIRALSGKARSAKLIECAQQIFEERGGHAGYAARRLAKEFITDQGIEKDTAVMYAEGIMRNQALADPAVTDRLLGPILNGLEYIRENVAPEVFATTVQAYLKTIGEVAKAVPISDNPLLIESRAVQDLFEFAAFLHVSGVKEPAFFLTNSSGTGVLDLFPVTNADSYVTISNVLEKISEKIIKKIPKSHLATASENALNWMFSDLRLLPIDAREKYVLGVSASFKWNEQTAERLGKPVSKTRLPLLAYAIEDPIGMVLKTLDNDGIRSELRDRKYFGEMVRFLETLGRASDVGTEEAGIWFGLARKAIDYSDNPKPGETKKDARKFFVRDKLALLNEIWRFYQDGTLDSAGLKRICGSLSDKQAKTDFVEAVHSAYYQLFASDMGLPREYALSNMSFVMDVGRYRRNLRALVGKLKTGQEFPEYVGAESAFVDAIPVLDAAVKAQAEGTFKDFKFSEGFRDELTGFLGKKNGATVLEGWRGDASSSVTLDGQTYKITETGSFEDGFYAGSVKGSTTCQDPKAETFHIGGIIGTIELPWVKQVVVKLGDSPDLVFRRRLFLVKGDDGKAILLVQPPYHAHGMMHSDAADTAVLGMLKEKYEPLGIEVRDIRSAYSDDRGFNTGYSTFASGRSPFFYIDGNAHSVFYGVGGALHIGRNGLHSREPGKEVVFPKGWSSAKSVNYGK